MRITRLISLIERCSYEYRNMEFRELGLGPTHHSYILYLCKNPGVSQEMITKVLHINKSNVTRNLQVLIDNGFVNKVVDANDKRSYLIYPTEKAIQVRPHIIEKIKKWNDVLLNGLPEDNKQQLIDWLKIVADNACCYVDDNVVEDIL